MQTRCKPAGLEDQDSKTEFSVKAIIHLHAESFPIHMVSYGVIWYHMVSYIWYHSIVDFVCWWFISIDHMLEWAKTSTVHYCDTT